MAMLSGPATMLFSPSATASTTQCAPAAPISSITAPVPSRQIDSMRRGPQRSTSGPPSSTVTTPPMLPMLKSRPNSRSPMRR